MSLVCVLVAPVVDFSRHEKGLLGSSQSLFVARGNIDWLGQPVPEGAKPSIDNVEGEVQVCCAVLCWLYCDRAVAVACQSSRVQPAKSISAVVHGCVCYL